MRRNRNDSDASAHGSLPLLRWVGKSLFAGMTLLLILIAGFLAAAALYRLTLVDG